MRLTVERYVEQVFAVELLTVQTAQTATPSPLASQVSALLVRHAVKRVRERVDGVEDELDFRLLDVDFWRRHLFAGTPAPSCGSQGRRRSLNGARTPKKHRNIDTVALMQ